MIKPGLGMDIWGEETKSGIEKVEERIVELECLIQRFIDIKHDRKLDRFEYPRYKNLKDLIFINKAFLHELKRNSDYLLQ